MNVLLNGDMSESDGMPVSTTPESTPLNSWQIFTSQGAFNGNVMQGDFDEALRAFVLNIRPGSLKHGEVTIRQRLPGIRAKDLNVSPFATFSAYLLHDQPGGTITCQLVLSKPLALDDWSVEQIACIADRLPVPAGVPTPLEWGDLNIGDTSLGLQVDIKFQWSIAALVPGKALFANFVLAPVPQEDDHAAGPADAGGVAGG